MFKPTPDPPDTKSRLRRRYPSHPAQTLHDVHHQPRTRHRNPAGPRLRITGLGQCHGQRSGRLSAGISPQHPVGYCPGHHAGRTGGEPGTGSARPALAGTAQLRGEGPSTLATGYHRPKNLAVLIVPTRSEKTNTERLPVGPLEHSPMPSSHQSLLCKYRYDALDRLIGHAPANEAQHQRFYCKSRLATEIQGAFRYSIAQHGDLLLAQQVGSGNTPDTMLLATDQQRSVLHVVSEAEQQQKPIAYSAYGHRRAENGLLSLLGFNGERPDSVSGHYLLGNGYRAFNPVLMRFNSPDSFSPFGKGGLNSYAYCSGDPVNYTDPTGHVFEFLQDLWKRFTTPNYTAIKSLISEDNLSRTQLVELLNKRFENLRKNALLHLSEQPVYSHKPPKLRNIAHEAISTPEREHIAQYEMRTYKPTVHSPEYILAEENLNIINAAVFPSQRDGSNFSLSTLSDDHRAELWEGLLPIQTTRLEYASKIVRLGGDEIRTWHFP